MIKIPKKDVQRCLAFHVPHPYPIETMQFLMDKKEGRRNIDISDYTNRTKFSEQKFVDYIEVNEYCKVLLYIHDPNEDLYHLTACQYDELMDALHGDIIPEFCKRYEPAQ